MVDTTDATGASDNSTTTVDDTTGTETAQEQETQKAGEGEANEAPKSNFDKYKESVKARFDEKDATIEGLSTQVQELKMQGDYNVAVAQFGEDAVTNDKVLSVREAHPTLTYAEAIQLAGVEAKPSPRASTSTFAGVPKIDGVPTEMTAEQLSKLNPDEFSKIDDLVEQGKVKILG